MFKGEITTDYTGASAFWEILIMLLVAFVLGWVARIIWERIISFHRIDETAIEKVIAKKIDEKKALLSNEKKIVRNHNEENISNDIQAEKDDVDLKSKKAVQDEIVLTSKKDSEQEKEIFIEKEQKKKNTKKTSIQEKEKEIIEIPQNIEIKEIPEIVQKKEIKKKEEILSKKLSEENQKEAEMPRISEIIDKKENVLMKDDFAKEQEEEIKKNIKIKRVRDEQNPFKLLKNDDLKIIEGIGPKIEILLKNANIITWSDLAKTNVDKLRFILKEGGDRFSFHNPKTWPEQASLAVNENWEELAEFQEFLSGGKIK